MIGLDDSTPFGRPGLLEGKIEDIFAEGAFIVVVNAEFKKLEHRKIGTAFEINGNRGVVLGQAKASASGLFGIQTLYTTCNRAITFIPSMRLMTSFLVESKGSADIPFRKQQIASLGYQALTDDESMRRISHFHMYRTGLGLNVMIMTLASLIAGPSISGQTFYTFILENLEKFGGLKAIGAKGKELAYLILFQAMFTALIGYGMGVGLAALIMAAARLRMPDHAAQVMYTHLLVAFIIVIIIAALSRYVGVRRVIRIGPFDIFRG
jgi:putative ABC transport system permease protein